MRITGGQAKGRLLATPKGLTIRPSSDRVREAIFNIVGQDLSGMKVLDLFAGTGSLGIEALSRGALQAVFVDHSKRALRLIEKNLALCGYEEGGSVLNWDLRRGLPRKYHFITTPFHLAFIDPPYQKGLIPPLLEYLSTKGMLSDGSRVVAETFKEEKLVSPAGRLKKVGARLYGDTMISIYDYRV